MPIWVSATRGRTARTENVPARTMPGRGDHAACHREALQHRLLRGHRLRLLAHACHEEDVVVDPQRDEEDEREEREARVLAGEVGEELEHEECQAERGAEREDDRRHEHERPDDRAQEQNEDREDDEEHERDEEERVRADGLAQVELLRRRPADENRVATCFTQLLPQRRDLCEALLAEGVLCEGDREERAGLAVLDAPHAATCGALPAAATTASSCAGSVTSTVVGALAPAGNERSSSFWPSTASISPRKALAVVRFESSVSMPSESASRPRVVTIQTARCRRSIHGPSLPQNPCCQEVSLSAAPGRS